MRYNDKNLRIIRRIREASSVGHHATVDASCRATRHFLKAPQLIDEFEHQFARAARLRF